MDNLSSSGLQLRTIQSVEYNRLIEDLQYNFTQILNSPGFKGRKGLTIKGDPGIGIRGSKWIFVTLQNIQQHYPITSIEQISLSFINSIFSDNPTLFFNSLLIPGDTSLLVGDILILPSGQLIELVDVLSIIQFIDTGITFAQVVTITEDRVIEIFNNLYGGINQNTSALRHYNAVAKNVSDASPALNQNLTQDSIIDIVTATSGPGAPLPTHTFVGATEQEVSTLTKMCFLAGSPEKYHLLLQETQRIHTNNYAPGIDDFASHIILQNSYKNGLLFGHSDSESIRNFGRLYKSVDSTVLTSSYSPLASEYSEINLFDDRILFRGNTTELDSSITKILSTTYSSLFFSFSGNVAKLADKANTSLEIYAPAGILLKNITSAPILSTDANGRLLKLYSVLTTLTGTMTNSQLITALAVQNALNPMQLQLADHEQRLNSLGAADTSAYFQKLPWQLNNVNLNTLTSNGNYVVPANTQISNFISGVSNAPSDMIINSFVSSIDATEQRILQEVTMSGTTEFVSYMNGIKWFRIGSKSGTSQWTFSNWSKTVTGFDKVSGSDGLNSSGSFNTGNMTIRHNVKNQNLQNSQNSDFNVIRNLVFDQYGHVVNYESVDVRQTLDTAFLKYFPVNRGFINHGDVNSTTVHQSFTSLGGDAFYAVQTADIGSGEVIRVTMWNEMPSINYKLHMSIESLGTLYFGNKSFDSDNALKPIVWRVITNRIFEYYIEEETGPIQNIRIHFDAISLD